MDLRSKVRETIFKYKMFSSGERVLVAVSGGPDSVALLHLLHDLQEEIGLRLEVAHLQHGIRGEEGREDALFVACIAAKLALPFHLKDLDLPGMRAQRGRGNLEAMGREERYGYFAALAEARDIQKIATGHTRADQMETLFMWLLRGSGRRGLGGMPPVRPIAEGDQTSSGPLLVRPLIEASREEVVDFLAHAGLEYRTDKTNLDPAPLRNWIRLRLLPQVREKFGPELEGRLAHSAEICRQEDEILERLARQDLAHVIQGQHLMRDLFLRLGEAMQRRVLRLWCAAKLGHVRGFGFSNVEEALEFIAHGPPQGRLSIPGGWDLVKRYGKIHIEKQGRNRQPVCYTYELPRQGGELVVPEANIRIEGMILSASPGATPRDRGEALFDPAALPETLTVRNFRHGDRFQPLGMRGHKKLKDLFIEKKVPLEVRSTLPLFLAGAEILWIPGYGRSDIAKIGSATREILRIRVEPGRA
ncbi:MAG: tRNA lysidine(34) synthetase TilS [Deltaproteobacteria bacterium]|nr:tRNA lysidine(34) synthetase TilS [Deltaproteobacteria bacterium]